MGRVSKYTASHTIHTHGGPIKYQNSTRTFYASSSIPHFESLLLLCELDNLAPIYRIYLSDEQYYSFRTQKHTNILIIHAEKILRSRFANVFHSQLACVVCCLNIAFFLFTTFKMADVNWMERVRTAHIYTVFCCCCFYHTVRMGHLVLLVWL